MKERVIACIQEVRPGIEDLDHRQDLDDIFDSLDIIQLVTTLEDAFDLEIDIEDITPENFASIEAIIGILS